MSDFQFKFSSGQVVYTGNIVPSFFPTSFREYPAEDLLSREDITTIMRAPGRKPARQRFPWILNQGRRSSCNAYACNEAYRKVRIMAGHPDQQFGPEYTYSKINRGQDRGSVLDAGMRSICTDGCAPRSMVPYEAFQSADISPKAEQEAKRFQAFECYQFPRGDLELLDRAIGTAIARDEGVVVAVHVDNKFDNMDSRGIVLPTDGPGNHAVHIDDLTVAGDGEFLFEHVGSWGPGMHHQGRAFVTTKRHFRTPSQYHAFYAIRSTRTDPKAPHPTLR